VSHHFDAEVAKEHSRLSILDMYSFEGASAATTAVHLTTNPDAGIFAPLTLHSQGQARDGHGDPRPEGLRSVRCPL
jgi:hypothetical protein